MDSLKRALLDGALVVLPLGAIVLLVVGIVRKLEVATTPLAGQFVHPVLVAAVVLALACLVVGLLVRSAIGRWVRRRLEQMLFQQIPGYRLVKAFAAEGPLAEDHRAMRPALVEIEEGQSPALIMDELADGRLLVFVPATPAPMSGSLYIFTPDRVKLLDVPVLPFIKAISSWGLGLRELLEAAPADQSPAASAGPAIAAGAASPPR
ncbi:MAG TPA: DUF502 domain-containing protein [Geminicoccaceae bacterium]|nr:DUF502 domain-containing protein [Geminicoccus sp.]HMU51454.1 DUF502 domain-containing protein [Geminicoccaceae bacterium]